MVRREPYGTPNDEYFDGFTARNAECHDLPLLTRKGSFQVVAIWPKNSELNISASTGGWMF